jgi:hypothetical protein
VTGSLGQNVAANATQQTKPHVRVAVEDSTDEIHRQMVVKEPESGECGQLAADGVFADSGWPVQEDQLHLDSMNGRARAM